MSLREITTLTAAETLRAKKVEIEQNAQTIFYEDVLHKDVYDSDGNLLGKITGIIQSPAHDVLVIKGKKEILIPLVENFVKNIGETITVDISALREDN